MTEERSPMAIASLGMGLMPYLLVGILFVLFELIADLGTFGLRLMTYYIAAIAACPSLGLLFALIALRRDIGTDWPIRAPTGITLLGITFNLFNGFILVLSKSWLLW